MGSAASTEAVQKEVAAKNVEEIAAALKELPADQLSKIKEAVTAGAAATPCPGPVDCSKAGPESNVRMYVGPGAASNSEFPWGAGRDPGKWWRLAPFGCSRRPQ